MSERSGVMIGVVTTLVGAVIGAGAAILGGVVSGAGAVYSTSPAFGQASGTSCLEYQTWVLDRIRGGFTDAQILTMSMNAVRGGTLQQSRTLPAADPTALPSVTVTATKYYVVCDHTNSDEIMQLIGELRSFTPPHK